ncbi:MAG: aminopeptidase P N-terminal domain-containing protein, partial [Candidatus Cloacimonetes bacterium]|nr:aminopeptidase P N-terminal domain-containing protein [Candidatus Cloacimonadota bacterium]
MNSSIFKGRRERLGNSLENGDIVIIFSASDPEGISRFLQNNNFLYLTGIVDVSEAILALAKTNDKINEMLFIKRNIPERIVWDGAKMYPEEAKELSGIDNIKFVDEFDDVILGNLFVSKKVYINAGLQ